MPKLGRHFKDKLRQLRYELKSAERMEAFYHAKMAKLDKLGWYWLKEETYSAIVHYQGRRRFFIKKLQEAQLKEFNRGEPPV